MIVRHLPVERNKSSAPTRPPAVPERYKDGRQRHLPIKNESSLSDKWPAGFPNINMRETLQSSVSEAHVFIRGGDAIGSVPDYSHSRGSIFSSVVPGEKVEPAPRQGTAGKSDRVKRDVSIDIRLTQVEREKIRARASSLGMKPSAWARTVMLDALDARLKGIEKLYSAVASTPDPDIAKTIEQLRRVGINLNQTRRAGDAVDSALLESVLEAVNKLRLSLGDKTIL